MSQILGAGEARSKELQAPWWPLLRTLEMISPTTKVWGMQYPPLPIQQLAPNVKSLTIDFGVLEGPEFLCKEMLRQEFAWATLSSLSISGIVERNDANFLFLLLAHAHNLQRMEVVRSRPGQGLVDPGVGIGGSSSRIDLPVIPRKLQHLSLELEDYTLKSFFQNVRFPALRSMRLRSRGEPRLYSRFIKWSLEDQCKEPDFWPQLERFTLVLGDNVLELREGDAGFAVLKLGPWTWWILSGTPFGTP